MEIEIVKYKAALELQGTREAQNPQLSIQDFTINCPLLSKIGSKDLTFPPPIPPRLCVLSTVIQEGIQVSPSNCVVVLRFVSVIISINF
ncbi:hypothetical protein V6N13_032553 [Hibiscus sabdariffa]